MNPESFFENFELLAESPNAIPKLREMILQMAVQGTLVEQNLDDEPAEVLLEKIGLEKERLVKEGSIKNPNKSVPIEDVEVPYKVPINWEWGRLSNIVYNFGQKKPDVEFTYIDVTSINKEIGVISNEVQILAPENAPSKARKIVKNGCIIYSTVRPYLLNIAIVDKDLNPEPIASTAFAVLNPYSSIYNKYLYYYLRSQPFTTYVESEMIGMAYPAINDSKLYKGLVPIPPLEEQKRIVAKVDKLMALCDQLESFQQKKNESRIQLNNAALNKIFDAGSPEEFAEHWQLVCDNFNLLYDDLDNMGKLKQVILQLAVQGKLVEQNENDEPAEVLLERIKVEKKRLVKEKKIKKIDTLNSISSDDILFELPLGWTWVRIGDLVKKLGAGSTPKGGKSVYQDEGIKFIRFQNVWNEGLKLENVALIPLEIHKKMNGTVVYPGDILLNITGASIGRSGVVPDEFDEGNVSQHVSILRLIDSEIRKFIHTCIISPLVQDAIMDAQVGISREGLSISRLKDFLIPLPPLAEQKRIVAKVDQLMTLCNQLEAKIKQAQSDSDVLMDVSLKKVLGEG